VVQINFSNALRIGFISFNLSSLDTTAFIKATQIKRDESDSQSITKNISKFSSFAKLLPSVFVSEVPVSLFFFGTVILFCEGLDSELRRADCS